MSLAINKEILPRFAVLLIDMQDNFICDREERQALIPNQVRVIRFCEQNNIPVVIVEYSGFGQTAEELVTAVQNLPLNNIYYVIKPQLNAFAETNLADLLKARKIEYLLIMGVSTCACIYETAFCALQSDYKIITSRDLIEGYWEEYRQKILWRGEKGHCYEDYTDLLQDLSKE